MIESQYLQFDRVAIAGRKTDVVNIYNKRRNVLLGEIRWYGPWRQYCFYPSAGTIFNRGCMTDIMTVITQLMDERR